MAQSDILRLDDIRAAAERIGGTLKQTPCLRSQTLSEMVGAEIWLKFENLQFTASFKERGALNKLLQLDADARKRGVIAMSAGNHAQGVAYHAKGLGIPATIVMPSITPFNKIRHVRGHGARVVLFGETLAEAATRAHEMAAAENLTFVHPYDDLAIMAGQGTVALEMLQQAPELDTLVVPVGGGGLIAGMAVAAHALKPDLQIYGVETELYTAMHQQLHDQPVQVGGISIAEGISVRDIGKAPMAVARQLVRDVLIAREADIERAIVALAEIEKTVAEGAGASGLAALLVHKDMFKGRKVGLVITGGNIDTRLLASVLMRGLVRDGRLARLIITTDDAPGRLAKAAGIIGSAGVNIVEVAHQRLFTLASAKSTEIEFVVEARDRAHLAELLDTLAQAGLNARLLDPMAAV
ncbi:threonine ammonia-lyase [Ferrovibrio sp.]|uniref:threonine ammonia-lyase n=1 Tax=Ferrovibrio sp. TaxID=1917215 RepID=UPI0025BDB4B6|nr:threonine ammonia-lyase [Ferrovibrio sp.]MBX3455192.1 threonine ammonia-lyase [Ferrovibrio sp.]